MRRFKRNLIIAAAIIFIASLGFLLNLNRQPALISYAYTLDDRGQLPGEYSGIGMTFDVQRSNAKNISVVFDRETAAHVESITGMVGMRIASVPETRVITVANLKPNTTYYKYVDHLDTRKNITTDEAGSITFSQDISQSPYIMIFEHPSTYFIEDNSTGGNCNTIGIWNGSAKTCTLTTDLTQSIEIKDNGITLDGNNRTVQGPDSNIGIFVNGGIFGDITDVTVKNITVRGFSKGIQINNTNNVRLINVNANNNADGVEFYRAEQSSIIDSTISNNAGKGLIVGTSSDINAVSNNAITRNGVGIDLGLNSQSSISQNDIKLNGNGIGVSAIGGADTYLWQNNLDNINQVSVLFDGDTQFHKEPPDRGNFWADHACVQDTANPNICTNAYAIQVPILSDKSDNYPWACEDGWARECPAETSTVAPTPTGETTPSTTPSIDFPNFTQIDSRWSSDLYDHSSSYKLKCGVGIALNKTIGNCGCLITSIVNVLHNYGITKDINGNDITPKTLDDWLTNNYGYTVPTAEKPEESPGNLIWTAIDQFVREKTTSSVKYHFGAGIDKYTTLETVMDNLNATLDRNIPAIAMSFNKDHFFNIFGREESRYLVRDPFWYDTKYLNETRGATATIRQYNNQIYKYSYYGKESLSLKSLMLILGSPAEILITDPLGRKLGYDPKSDILYKEIPSGSYWEQSFLDPVLIGSFAPDISKYLYVENPIEGDYSVEIIGIDDGDYLLTMKAYGSTGHPTTKALSQGTSYLENDKFVISFRDLGETLIQGSDKLTICHVPPGNSENAHTISIGRSALETHLAHGDYEGECLQNSKTKSNGRKK